MNGGEKRRETLQFRIIDKTTGHPPSISAIMDIAKNGDLFLCDIDQFYVGEDGAIALADDCGNMTFIDPERFTVEIISR